jgi:hypothetical protein
VSKAKKTPEKTPEPKTPPLIPQEHGGALLAGGVPGNKGGTGRPPNVLRSKSRAVYEKFLEWADKEASKDAPDPNVMAQIGRITSSVGIPKQSEVKHSGLFALAARLETMSAEELQLLLTDAEAKRRLLEEVTDGE